MHGFSQIATKLLKEYKVLTKRFFSPEESEEKLKELGLNGRLPRLEANLYRSLVAVSEKMSKDYRKGGKIRYSGAQHFSSHLQEVLSEYQLSGKKVIHVQREVSRVVLKAVQLMSLPQCRLTDELFSALDEKANLVAKHGEKEQQRYFERSLKANIHREPDFFASLVKNFTRYLKGDEYSDQEVRAAHEMVGEPA
jgi:hypothetical protein